MKAMQIYSRALGWTEMIKEKCFSEVKGTALVSEI